MEWGWRTRPRLDTICSQIESPVPGMGYFFWNRGWKAQGDCATLYGMLSSTWKA